MMSFVLAHLCARDFRPQPPTPLRSSNETIVRQNYQIPLSMGQKSFVDVLLCPDIQDIDMDEEQQEQQEGVGVVMEE